MQIVTKAEDRKLQRFRINELAVLVMLVFCVLLARLWYLQIALGNSLLEQSEANSTKLIRMRAPRGTILDCKNRVLATSRPQFVVMAVKEQLEANPEAFGTLCQVLKITPEELEARMTKAQDRPGSPTRVDVDVPLETVARVSELRTRLPGVTVELDNLRYYPDGPAIAHIMGYLGEISKNELEAAKKAGKDYRPGDYVGKTGIEKQYEDELRGIDGGKEVIVNAFGRVVRIKGEEPYVQGKTLKLTIDRDLQIAAARALGNRVGAAIALDPKTGAVLAMVSSPQYDPNVFVKKVSRTDWNKIILNKHDPLQNRSVYNVYPPGSTFKPMAAIAGLAYGECSPDTTVSCSGSFYYGRTFRDWRAHGRGVNLKRAIAESCDVWFYRLSVRLGIDRLAKVVRQFGLGSATGIDLPNESRYKDGHVGTMPDTAWKKKRFAGNPEQQKWWPGETPSCGIGQGYIQASPLQMALSSCAVFNLGRIYKPHLLDQVCERDGRVIRRVKPVLTRKVNAPTEHFQIVKDAMRLTVTAGTGRSCDVPGVVVGAKTGSAEDPPRPAHGWFICWAYAGNKQIAAACIVEHGRHGSTSAGPVCRAILDVYFGKKKPEEIGSGTARVRGD